MGELTTSALMENVPGLIASKCKGRLVAVLVELGRRGAASIATLRIKSVRIADAI